MRGGRPSDFSPACPRGWVERRLLLRPAGPVAAGLTPPGASFAELRVATPGPADVRGAGGGSGSQLTATRPALDPPEQVAVRLRAAAFGGLRRIRRIDEDDVGGQQHVLQRGCAALQLRQEVRQA